MRRLSAKFVSVMVAMMCAAGGAEATTYYVKTNGKDSKNGRSPGQAFKTISKAMTVANAGDTVYIGKGTYTAALTTTRAGTSATSKIRFVGDTTGAYLGGGAGTVTINVSSGTAVTVNHDNVEFERLIIQGGTKAIVVNAAGTGVALRNCTVQYGSTNLLDVQAGTPTITSCTLQGSVSRTSGPIKTSGSAGILMDNTTVCNMNGAVFTLGGTGATTVIDRNTFYANAGWNFDVTGPSVRISNNLIRNCPSGNGIRVQNGSVQIWNNTLYQAGATAIQQTGGTLTAKNNIICGSTTGLNYSAGALTHSNNMYWSNGTAYIGTVASPADVAADPMFVNSASDWRPQASSLAIDHGASGAGVVLLDRIGGPRPTGLAWDIGAYEAMGYAAPLPYFTDFEGSVTAGAEWTVAATNTAAGSTRFSGPYGNSTLGLRVTTVPGTAYTLVFDAYLLGTWEGDNTSFGPDYFNVAVDGASNLRETYDVFNHGYGYSWPDVPEKWSSSIYSGGTDGVFRRVVVDFTASSTVSYITFFGENLSAWPDEGWGIDNVRVLTSITSAAYRPHYEESGLVAGFAQTGDTGSMGLLAADIDNDGQVDVLQASTAGANLYGNIDVAFTATPIASFTGQAAFADFDNDGYMDLCALSSVRGEAAALFRNDGAGALSAMTSLGLGSTVNSTNALAACDLNGDGICDVAMFGASGNWAMLGAITTRPGGTTLSYSLSSSVFPNSALDKHVGMYCASADINNDGYTDFYYNAFGGTFFVSNGDGTYSRNNLGISPGVLDGDKNGAAFADLDNDGIPELVCGNRSGALTLWRRGSTSGLFTDIAGTRGLNGINNVAGVATGDFDNDGDLDLLLTFVSGSVALFSSSGGPTPTFTLANLEGVSTECAGGDAMFVDVDNGGNLAVALGSESTTYPSRLYENSGNYLAAGATPAAASSYLYVRVLGRGIGGINKAGVGARVELWNAANTAILARREIGEARGLGGQGNLWTHFGGVDPSQTYTLRIVSGSRSYTTSVIPGAATTTIGATTIPQMYTFDESTMAAVQVLRWREVSSDD